MAGLIIQVVIRSIAKTVAEEFSVILFYSLRFNFK